MQSHETHVNKIEMKQYVTDGTPIIVVPADHTGKSNPHTHDFCEIVYVAEGFTLHQSCGKITMLITGDLFFVKPGELHSYINAYQTKLYNLLFDPSCLGSMRESLSALPCLDEMLSFGNNDFDLASRLIHVSIDKRRNIEHALEQMLDERKNKQLGWDASLQSRLISFLVNYARMFADMHSDDADESKNRHSNDYYGYIYKLLCHIDKHYAEELTMNELSEVTGLSPDYMTRKFKAILGMTPIEYLRKFRIAKAMELLCTTDLTVSEISDKVGFSDVSLFSRVFKQNVGLPPASYRKNTAE